MVGFLITISIGILISLMTGRNHGRKIDPKLMYTFNMFSVGKKGKMKIEMK